jgi:hypothetical protein
MKKMINKQVLLGDQGVGWLRENAIKPHVAVSRVQ